MLYSAVITVHTFVASAITFHVVFHARTSLRAGFAAAALLDALPGATGLQPRGLSQ